MSLPEIVKLYKYEVVVMSEKFWEVCVPAVAFAKSRSDFKNFQKGSNSNMRSKSKYTLKLQKGSPL